jgi:pSer/pThr/pTyr-binding forkhead associated (FHA) protein
VQGPGVTICTQCGRQNEERSYFCSGCGANLKAQRQAATEELDADGVRASGQTCPACGALVPVAHVFCGSCGARQHQRTVGVTAVPEELVEEAEPRARLVLLNPDGSSGESVPLRMGENVFGRDHGPPPFREDPYLSPRHVAFHLEAGRLQVRDLDSLNGVYYRISDVTEILHGDHLRVGRQLLRFESLDQLESVPLGPGSAARSLGAPRGDAWGRLVRVSSPVKSSQAFLLSGPEEVIGRERGSLLLRDDGFVSGRHARLTTSGTRVFLEDLRSSNGTFVRVRSSRNVSSGDLLLLGQQPLRVLLE